MIRNKGAVCLAACAGLAVGRVTWGADPATPPAAPPVLSLDASKPAPLPPPVTPPPPTPSSPPVMRLMEAVGVGHPMEDAGFSLTGYVQGSFTHDFSSPPGGYITDRAFDTRSDSPQLDQVELLLNKDWNPRKRFDYGLTFESIYGTDTPYFHANGLTLVSYGKAALPYAGSQSVIYNTIGPGITVPLGIASGQGSTATIQPKAQYDPTQLNFTFGTGTVASGLAVQIGKFVDLLGAEQISPGETTDASSFLTRDPSSPAPLTVTNNFLSHSFIFVNEPYTNTGLLGLINVTRTIGFTGGITRGWNQATEAVNGNVDLYGQFRWAPDRKTKLQVSVISGNEQPDIPFAFGIAGQNGWRTVVDVVGEYKLSDQLSVAANGMYAWEAQTGNAGYGGGTGQWYGAAAYASYRQSDYLSFNARAEWFDDQDGAAPAQFAYYGPSPSIFGPARRPNLYYELTVGMTIHPLPNQDLLEHLFFRPELRFDYADKSTFDFVGSDPANNGTPTDHYLFTFGIDGVYAF